MGTKKLSTSIVLNDAQLKSHVKVCLMPIGPNVQSIHLDLRIAKGFVIAFHAQILTKFMHCIYFGLLLFNFLRRESVIVS